MYQFDRHKEMSSDTVTEVLQLIKLVEDFKLQNYLYGLFDGYDYSSEILAFLDYQSKEVKERLERLISTIKSYKKFL